MKRFSFYAYFFLLLVSQLVAFDAAKKSKELVKKLPNELREKIKLYAIQKLFPQDKYVEVSRHDVPSLRDFALFPDGKKIALQGWYDVHVYDIEKGTLLQKIRHRDIKGIDVFPCNKKVAILAEEKVYVWDLEKDVCSIHGTYYEDAKIAVFNDGKRIVLGKSYPKLINLESHGSQTSHRFDSGIHDAATRDLKVFPLGNKIATTDQRCVIIWDVATGKKQQFLHHADSVLSMVIFPDGQKIATASGGTITTWDAVTVTKLKEYNSTATFYTLDISSDGTKIACGGNDSEVTILDANLRFLNTTVMRDSIEDMKHVYHVKFLPNSSDFMSRTDYNVKRWVAAKPYLTKYFDENKDRDIQFLLWLLLKYKNFLHEKYPARRCMRIEDLVSYANELNPKKNISLDSLTVVRNRMPKDIQRVMARSLGLYTCSDKQLEDRISRIRRHEFQDRPRKEALARAYANLR